MASKLQCHCGNIGIEVERLLDLLGDCNCSICRLYKSLWGYYAPPVHYIIKWQLSKKRASPTLKYCISDGMIELNDRNK